MSKLIVEQLIQVVKLPRMESELEYVMNRFQKILKLPYCVCAVGGTHVPWKYSPATQYSDYRCCKGFTSFVFFAVSDSRRRFLYAEAGYPGIMGDSTIFEVSKLKSMIEKGEWLGEDISSLKIGEVNVRPYLIGDCVLTLNTNMVKTSIVRQQRENSDLKLFEKHAAAARKPIECAFEILKIDLLF